MCWCCLYPVPTSSGWPWYLRSKHVGVAWGQSSAFSSDSARFCGLKLTSFERFWGVGLDIYYNLFFCDKKIYTGRASRTAGNWKEVWPTMGALRVLKRQYPRFCRDGLRPLASFLPGRAPPCLSSENKIQMVCQIWNTSQIHLIHFLYLPN